MEETALYKAVVFLSKKCGVAVCDFKRLREMGMENPSVPDIARISGFCCREVMLSHDWPSYKYEPVLIQRETDDKPAVIYHSAFGGIRMYDPEKNRSVGISAAECRKIATTGYVFGRSLGFGEVKGSDMLKFAAREISAADVAVLILAMFLVTLIQLSVTHLSQMIYSRIIPAGDIAEIFGVGSIFLSALIAGILFSLMQVLTQYRLTSRIKYRLQEAVYDRAFRLPENFYRDKDSGEQAFRIDFMASTYVMILQNGITIFLYTAFSGFYCARMLSISKSLSVVGFVVVAASVALSVVFAVLLRRLSRKRAGMTGKMRAFLYQLIGGITTVRVSGGEKFVTEKYLEQRGRIAENDYRMARLQQFSTALTALVNTAGMTAMYALLGSGKLQLQGGDFVGFLSANTMLGSSVTAVSGAVVLIFSMLPMLKNSSEILQCIPERSDTGEVLKDFRGDITVSHVSFSYEGSNNKVLNDLSLHVSSGEYVAIVGSSGCGKSTLLRLLLGFEKPLEGTVKYDGVDMEVLNHPFLRRQMGVVLQDGCLFSGSIYKNLSIACPQASKEEIKEALSMAAFDKDLQQMPMGIHTFVSEEAQTLSGGQKQKILIARAVLGKPKLLLMDEATSALDNISQQRVTENLDKIKATRIVIAHRLSTVKNCDRIILLDGGTIAEEGSYEELMERRGKFYQMAVKQVV